MVTIGPIEALGTRWYVECFSTIDIAELQAAIESFLETFENRYSRFLSDSLVSTLNRERRVDHPTAEFIDLLSQAKQYYELTDGVFNVLVGERLRRSGYDRDYSFIASEDTSELPNVQESLLVSPAHVELLAGELDLGGIGKGYCVDRLAEYLHQKKGCTNIVVNGGGDIRTIYEDGKKVTLTLAHPTQAGQSIGSVEVANQGFAASSPYLRTWKDKRTEKPYNHLLTTNNISSYVIAPTCTEADIWATTLALSPHVEPPPEVQCVLLQEDTLLQAASIFKLNTAPAY